MVKSKYGESFLRDHQARRKWTGKFSPLKNIAKVLGSMGSTRSTKWGGGTRSFFGMTAGWPSILSIGCFLIFSESLWLKMLQSMICGTGLCRI